MKFRLKDILLFMFVFTWLFILAWLIWNNITFAEWQEIVNKKSYIEKMRIQEQQIQQLWEEENAKCNENLEYYHSQAVYLRATIEQEEANLSNMLGLSQKR